ncbi:DNA-binding transcriptional LysR family regulator [Paenochrobactrum gallinarii]|uniref:DNA-binding transcriptional LysR family regulator n=1 Tax=Paenochrobactrum gallinarii TaxID=643673 RepID=A0A841M370_9HYPH|nr:LysR family transcriptional regulator [Paenochrobactrum gallinarii]MBB6260588.1 DNA-binding transcriptional LysR family regulator [Paenochrobactrum gallinarii]
MSYIKNLRVFIRVVELGNLSAAGRDQRASPAVASNRIKELEKHLGVRLFNRTTRKLTPTEHGRVFYEGAVKIIEAVEEAEAAITDILQNPKGALRITAPLSLGRTLIGPSIPDFHAKYPDIEVRLRLSDHEVDIMSEGVDVAFKLGILENSNLRMRGIMNCERVICAAPEYLERRGTPQTPDDLINDKHDCLLLRFPGSKEYYWTLQTPEGLRKFEIAGPYDSDDSDVLTQWALSGHGLINKPLFEVKQYINEGKLVPVLTDAPPASIQLAAIYPHKRFLDPKIRLIIDYMADRCHRRINEILKS